MRTFMLALSVLAFTACASAPKTAQQDCLDKGGSWNSAAKTCATQSERKAK